MKPHELVKALVDGLGGSFTVAKLMGQPTFQGTLYKFCNGDVASPERSTAEKISKFFRIPIEAIYDSAVATQVARDRLKPGQVVEEPPPVCVVREDEARDEAERRLLTAFRQVLKSDRDKFIDQLEARAEEILAIASELSGSETRMSRAKPAGSSRKAKRAA